MADGLNISKGMGEGAAQIFKPFDYSYQDRQEASRQKDAATRAAAGQKNLSDLSKQLQSLNKLDIFHRDQPLFQQKNKELWDYANKNIRAIRNGDTNTKLAIDQMVADIENTAELSKNVMNSYVQVANQLATSGNATKLREESKAYIEHFASPENAGNFGFDPTQIKFNYDYVKDKDSNFRAEAKAKADKGTIDTYPDPVTGITQTTKTNSFSLTEAQDMVRRGYESDPQALEQANYVISKSPELAAKYKDSKTPQLDYLVDTEAAKYVIKGNDKTYKHVGKPDFGFGIKFGDGVASTEDWDFAASVVAQPAPLSTKETTMQAFGQPVEKKEETIYRISASPRKGTAVTKERFRDPKDKDSAIDGILDGWEINATRGTVNYLVKTSDDEIVSIPEEQVTATTKAKFGATVTDLIKGGILKKPSQSAEQSGVAKNLKGGAPAEKVKVKNADGKVGYMSRAAYEAHKDKYTIVK